MNVADELVPILKKLRLSGVLQTMDIRNRQATEDNLCHMEFLYRLLCDEVERREAKQLNRRLRRAKFDYAQTLEDFDYVRRPAMWSEVRSGQSSRCCDVDRFT